MEYLVMVGIILWLIFINILNKPFEDKKDQILLLQAQLDNYLVKYKKTHDTKLKMYYEIKIESLHRQINDLRHELDGY